MDGERRLRKGDRVVLRSDLEPERELEIVQRGLPMATPGLVHEVHPGRIVIVRFLGGRSGFVREEELQLLMTSQEREQQKERLRQQKQLQRDAERVGVYMTPETVDQAYAFGRREGLRGREQRTRGEFLSTATEHRFPESLWRSYQVGHRHGLRVWRENQT